MTIEQQKAQFALYDLIAYHRSTWDPGDGYVGNEQLIYITEFQAQIALRYDIPIGIRDTCPTRVGCPAGKLFRYITLPDYQAMKRWLSYREMDKLPSIHASFPRHIQQRMRDYILQIMEIECPERLPPQKPVAPLLGAQGDIYGLLCIAYRALQQAGQPEHADQMWRLVLNCGNYFSAISIMQQYVDFGEAALPRPNK